MRHNYTRSRDRITLKPLERPEIETLRGWRNDSAGNPYITRLPFITGEMQEQWYSRYLEDENCATMSAYHGQDLIGSVSLYGFSANTAEFGKLMVGAPFRGLGFGYDITKACVDIGFEDMGLDTIIASVHTENLSALKIYIKIGFIITGKAPFSGGVEGDEFLIELTKERYNRLQ